MSKRPFCMGHLAHDCGCWPDETAEEACAAGRHWSVQASPDGNFCPGCHTAIMDRRYPRMVRADAIPMVFPAFPPGR